MLKRTVDTIWRLHNFPVMFCFFSVSQNDITFSFTRLCQVLNLNPTPILIAEVVFSNIGGTATGNECSAVLRKISMRSWKSRGSVLLRNAMIVHVVVSFAGVQPQIALVRTDPFLFASLGNAAKDHEHRLDYNRTLLADTCLHQTIVPAISPLNLYSDTS